MLLNKTRQYNILIFHKSIFFKYRTRQIETNKVKKIMLLNKIRQYNIHIFNKIILFKYRTRQIRATETNK